MNVLRKTSKHDRRSISIDRAGVTVRIERPRVGGGYFVEESITVAWPWKKVS